MRACMKVGAVLGVGIMLQAACGFGQEAVERTWADASGKFSVRATLKEKTASAVSLITADGRQVEVPIARLSDGDKAYLASLDMPADNPFAGGVPLEGMADLVPLVGGPPAAEALDSPREPVEFAVEERDPDAGVDREPAILPGEHVGSGIEEASDAVRNDQVTDPAHYPGGRGFVFPRSHCTETLTSSHSRVTPKGSLSESGSSPRHHPRLEDLLT